MNLFGAILLLGLVLALVLIPVHGRPVSASVLDTHGEISGGMLCDIYHSVGVLGFGCLASSSQTVEQAKGDRVSDGLRMPFFSSLFEHLREQARKNSH